MTRLVLDTNVLVSALLFRSEASALFDAWRGGRFRLAVSEPILDEYTRVLEYPKFRLSELEATGIMRQFVLPYCDRFRAPDQPHFCSDPDDDKFIHCALAADAAALVSGDRAVLTLGPPLRPCGSHLGLSRLRPLLPLTAARSQENRQALALSEPRPASRMGRQDRPGRLSHCQLETGAG